jgi:NitT/TauT family transport system substrate-binding protein
MPNLRAAVIVACALTVNACSSDENPSTTAAKAGPSVQMGRPFPAERCEDNRAAGTITYLSGYDFAASASIVDVLVAEQKGYYDDLCLDVEIKPGFSSENYKHIVANTAQFASAGSFSGLVTFTSRNPEAELAALAIEGRSANDTLIVKQGIATDLTELEGATIGVKGGLPTSVRAMLAKAGLVEGSNFTIAQLDGFDPTIHIELAEITAFTGFRSNEPGQLARAGIAYNEFDPSSEEIPGSFGVVYTSREFVKTHPVAVTDFMRATMKGLADAVSDPAAASMIAIDFIDNNGNPNGLSPDGEAFRWETEANLVADSSSSEAPLGMPDPDALRAEVELYASVGLYGGKAPDISELYDTSVLTEIYDSSGMVVWPST